MGSLQGLCMLPGLDDASYAANSGFQHSVAVRCRPILEKAIALHQAHLLELRKAVPTSQNCSADSELPDDGGSDSDAYKKDIDVFCIADMGSSSGPNCLANMQFVVDTIRNCNPSGRSRPVQCFFCDLPFTDFNTLFQLLHAQYPRLHHQEEQEISGCSAAAVAGTIYGRLFPPSSLHFVFSFGTLHWLSQVPQEVTTPGTPEWNKGKILVDGTNEAAKRAYAHQWHQDMVLFLKCRMLELVQGGMMFLVILFASPNSVQPHHLTQNKSCLRNLERSWQELVDEGLMEEIELDSFNAPMYLPNLEEIKSALNSVSELRMQSLEVLEELIEGNYWQQWSHDLTNCAKRLENYYRSLLQSLIEKHVGTMKCEAIFNRFTKVVEESLQEQLTQNSSWVYPPSSCVIIQLIKDI